MFSASQAHLDPKFGLANALILLTSSLLVAEAVAAARLGKAYWSKSGWLADPARVALEPALILGGGPQHAQQGRALFGAFSDSPP